ncbi:hypothetical protein A3195_09705 [Candidatus Thiodiazotropha endoloripes]|uniref:helix-turn-helix domain-containing protein n=1 Tax=Candidatus Thiodiazotropha endoloripes TaxID=1818881 RepID=UPI00083E5298|nr:helix-turn-helix domain-containing protein [Candidatus Thiodiazotropha endoloripes]ODB83988.1 hypothetical protein A3193_14195 [Candidatus Thiodiazotropha endoloripes]ODB91649.1 hypothetical protein A3195_09705 [Candidatus Thiodiazotropha endoloripes]
MQPEIDLYSAIMLLGAVQGMFLALALINAKSGLPVAHRLLALLTLTFSIDLWMAFLHQSGHVTSYPRLLVIDTNIDFLFGPLTYLYVTALTARSGFHFTLQQWRHFLPFLLGFVILIPLMLLDQQQLQSLLNSQGEQQDSDILWAELAMIVVGVLSILQMALYLGLSIKRLLQHQKSIEDQFSFLERINLAWLKNLLLALVVLYLFYLADVFLADLLAFPEEVIGIHFLMIVLVIYSMGYLGLRQPAIFTQQDRSATQTDGQSMDAHANQTDANLNDREPTASHTKYQRSALDSKTSQLLYEELQNHMDEQRTFLDSKLTLPQLAAQLSISPNYLSQVINEQAECNFFDFINRYRVEEAQRHLTAGAAQVNILGIALDAGFNSKSAFYTAFKRHTGQTPSQYRKSANIQTNIRQSTD